jgi:hypothetical protein
MPLGEVADLVVMACAELFFSVLVPLGLVLVFLLTPWVLVTWVIRLMRERRRRSPSP